MWTVYKHTAPNGKVYIGITGQKVKNRWRKNGHGYEKQIFYRAIKKYGWENFNHEILFEGLTKKQAGEMEQHLIEKYDCIIPKGYNKSKGGECGTLGVHPSDETRRKLSEAHKGQIPWIKGKHLSIETRKKLSEANKGKHLSSETRRKMSESLKGKKPSAECIRKSIESHKGKHRSVETRKKISEANKGKSSPWKGKHLSTETRQKLSESHKGKNAKAVICVETGILYSSIAEAAKSIGVAYPNISRVLHGVQKTCGGYHWKYVEM